MPAGSPSITSPSRFLEPRASQGSLQRCSKRLLQIVDGCNSRFAWTGKILFSNGRAGNLTASETSILNRSLRVDFRSRRQQREAIPICGVRRRDTRFVGGIGVRSAIRSTGSSQQRALHFGPACLWSELREAKSVRADRSFCWLRGRPKAARTATASSVLLTTPLPSDNRPHSIDSQDLQHDPLNLRRLTAGELLQAIADRGNSFEAGEPDRPELRRIDLRIAADDTEISVEQSRIEQRRQAKGLFGRQLTIRVINVVQMILQALDTAAIPLPAATSSPSIVAVPLSR